MYVRIGIQNLHITFLKTVCSHSRMVCDDTSQYFHSSSLLSMAWRMSVTCCKSYCFPSMIAWHSPSSESLERMLRNFSLSWEDKTRVPYILNFSHSKWWWWWWWWFTFIMVSLLVLCLVISMPQPRLKTLWRSCMILVDLGRSCLHVDHTKFFNHGSVHVSTITLLFCFVLLCFALFLHWLGTNVGELIRKSTWTSEILLSSTLNSFIKMFFFPLSYIK